MKKHRVSLIKIVRNSFIICRFILRVARKIYKGHIWRGIQISRELNKGGHKVLSIDLFDTLLLRSRPTNPEVSSLFQEEIFKSPIIRATAGAKKKLIDLRHYYLYVLNCEKSEESDIFAANENAISWLYDDGILTDSDKKLTASDILEAETNAEILNIKINPVAHKTILLARKIGFKISATSDTYLPKEKIEKILESHDCLKLFDYVITSSEYNCTKAYGGLFSKLCEITRSKPNEILHIGDNENSDFKSAIKSGLDAKCYINFGNELRKIKAMLVENPLIRHAPSKDPELLFADLLAVFFLENVIYAKRKGIKKLFFCTRDASLLGDAGQKALALLNISDIEVNSIAINRKMARLGVTDFHQSADPAQIDSHQKHFYQLYFLKKIANSTSLIVDIGYAGSIFSDICRAFPSELHLLHFSLLANSSRIFSLNGFNNHLMRLRPVFLLDYRNRPVTSSLTYSWLEAWARDPSIGELQGYQKKLDDSIVPIFDEVNNKQSLLHERNIRIDGIVNSILRFAKKGYLTNPDLRETIKSEIIQYVDQYSAFPTSSEIKSTLNMAKKCCSQQLIPKETAFYNLRYKFNLTKIVQQDLWVPPSLVGASPFAQEIIESIFSAEMKFRSSFH